MKVIKEGIIPETKEIQKTCSKCQCVFLYTQADKQYDRDGNYVVCPTCKTFITV